MNVHSHVVPCPCSWGGRGWTDWEFWSLVTHSLGAHSILSLAVQHSWHQEHWTSADPTRTASSKMLHSFPGHPALQDGSRDTGCTGTVQRTGGRSLHLGLQDVLAHSFNLFIKFFDFLPWSVSLKIHLVSSPFVNSFSVTHQTFGLLPHQNLLLTHTLFLDFYSYLFLSLLPIFSFNCKAFSQHTHTG